MATDADVQAAKEKILSDVQVFNVVFLMMNSSISPLFTSFKQKQELKAVAKESEDVQSLPPRAYLDATVTPVLLEALKHLAQER